MKAKPITARKSNENLTSMAYVVQLGSFSNSANVKALQAKLKDKGFKTFTKPVKTPNGTLTKVFVGPSLNESELRKKLPELKVLTKLNGRSNPLRSHTITTTNKAYFILKINTLKRVI